VPTVIFEGPCGLRSSKPPRPAIGRAKPDPRSHQRGLLSRSLSLAVHRGTRRLDGILVVSIKQAIITFLISYEKGPIGNALTDRQSANRSGQGIEMFFFAFDSRRADRGGYLFIDSRNSLLVLVFLILSIRNSMLSTVDRGLKTFRRIHILFKSSLSTRSSSLRVPD